MATIGCALALSNPTHEKPNPNPLPSVTTSVFSSEQYDPRSKSELSARYPVTRADKTEGGSKLIFPLVLVGEAELEERVPIIGDFMQRSFDAGVDGVILWQYVHQGYCGELDYIQSERPRLGSASVFLG